MVKALASTRFTQMFDTLPEDAQRNLVEKYLVPLLNSVPKERSKRVLKAAARAQTRYRGIPDLNLKGKKEEVNALLDELEKDAKRASVKGRSNWEELLGEVVDSIVDWLNDIWSVAYEYGTNFDEAHRCLLYAAGIIDHLANSRGGCKCSFMTMYVPIVIKKRNGKIVKSFTLSGAQNIDEALLWIWRDLTLTMLASGTERIKRQVPEILKDIEATIGWRSIERLLYGGKRSHSNHLIDNSDDSDLASELSESISGDEIDLDDFSCDCSYHAEHWTYRINEQIVPLRKLVSVRLIEVFKLTPQLRLWQCLLNISTEPDLTEAQLKKILSSVAAISPDTFAAALDIYASENQIHTIASLLDSNAHLLSPRHAVTYQSAVIRMSHNPFFQMRAQQILEKELLDTAKLIRAAVTASFSNIDKEENKRQLEDILRLRQGADARRDRIESWVDAISTPGLQTPNPMTIAAIMMGLPLGGMGDGDEMDPINFLDIDHSDPDLEDLRDELRPKLKSRFETWVEAAGSIKGGSSVLPKVYKELVGDMPYLKAYDAVDEMIGRLADKPSKHHVCDALDALSHFVKTQRKKMLAHADKKRKGNKDTHATTSGRAGQSSSHFSPYPPMPGAYQPSPTSSPDVGSSTIANSSNENLFSPPIITYGGLEDVD